MSIANAGFTETVAATTKTAATIIAAPAHDNLTVRHAAPMPALETQQNDDHNLLRLYENTACPIRWIAKAVALGGATYIGANLSPENPVAGSLIGLAYATAVATTAYFVRNRHEEGAPVEAESKAALSELRISQAISDEFGDENVANMFGAQAYMVGSATGKALVCNNVTQLVTYPVMGVAKLLDAVTDHKMPVAEATVKDIFSRIGLITPMYETPEIIERCSLLKRRAARSALTLD